MKRSPDLAKAWAQHELAYALAEERAQAEAPFAKRLPKSRQLAARQN